MYSVFFLIFCLFSSPILAQTELVKVLDGDTVIIRDNGQTLHIRLLDIDAPELHQPYGKQSQRSLRQWCQPPVTVLTQGYDTYGRTLGRLLCNNQDASEYQLSVGAAWFSRHYSQNSALAELEQTAQTEQRGLWQAHNPMPPWQWRKQYGKNYQHQ